MEALVAPLAAPLVWLAAGLIALVLESAGTPVGARKRGARQQLAVVVAVAACIVVAIAAVSAPISGVGVRFDPVARVATTAIALLVAVSYTAAVPQLSALHEERGENAFAYAVVGAALTLMVMAVDVVVLLAGGVLLATALPIVLAPDRDSPHAIEAAVKSVVAAGIVLAFLAFAAVLAYAAVGDTGLIAIAGSTDARAQAAIACFLVAVAYTSGVVPVHQGVVDVTHGAAPGASSLVGPGALLAASVPLLRVVTAADSARELGVALAIGALATVVGAPLLALDQIRISRLAAYLAIVPVGLVWAGLAAHADQPATAAARAALLAALAGAVSGAAALISVDVPSVSPSATWESWSGFGRKRPVLAALLVYALSSLAGLPGTPGFGARLDTAAACLRASSTLVQVLGAAVLISIALSAAPVVRVALFFFAKEPAHGMEFAEQGVLRRGVVIVLSGLGVAVTLFPSVLDGVLERTFLP